MKGLVTVGKSFINDGFSIATFDCRRAIAEWSKKQIGAYIVTSPNMGKRSEIAWSVWFLKWSSIAWFSGANVFRFWLVGGFKHFLFSISYMGCHPSHWRTHIFQDGYCTTNQLIISKEKSRINFYSICWMLPFCIYPLVILSPISHQINQLYSAVNQ